MMKKTNIIPLLFLWSALQAQEHPVVVRFSTGSIALNEQAIQDLRELCDRAESRTLNISGHSDGLGTNALNERLSLDRAKEVMAIVERTCPTVKITSVTGHGGSQPVADNSTENGRAMNRRVEIALNALQKAECLPVLDPVTAHDHRSVRPLLPGADKTRELHRLDASGPIEARMSDGTIIRIPAGAIIDVDGNIITGSIDLTYRGFTDPWEVVASGIPMHISASGEIRHFETAGMYEVYASQEGLPLRMRPGAELTLETNGPQVTSAYGAYMLNEETGAWEQGGRFVDAVPLPSQAPTAAAREYISIMERKRPLPDSTRFTDRMNSPYYCYDQPCIAARRPFIFARGKYRSPYGASIPAIQVTMDRDLWKKSRRIAFTVKNSFRKHPEWRSLDPKKRWLYAGDMERAAFRKAVSRKHFYQDIELVALNDVQGMIRLKDRGSWMEIPVVMADEMDGNKDPKDMSLALANYGKRFEKRANAFDRDVDVALRRTHAQRNRINSQAYIKATRRMSATEKAMDTIAFHEYAYASVNNHYRSQQQRDNTAAFSRRPTFAMPGFGIWNCDRMIPMPVVEVPVEVLALDGTPFIWRTAYGVPANGRAVVTYWNIDGKGEQLMRLSTACERMIFIGDDDKMVVAEVPEGKRVKKGGIKVDGLPLEQPKDRKVLEVLARRSD